MTHLEALALEDPHVAAAVPQLFHDEGIEILTGTRVLEVAGRSGEGIRLEVESSAGRRGIEATDLLVAAGRTPNTWQPGLEEAGAALDSRGYIKLNGRLETTAPKTWAIGDCAGTQQFTHAAFDDFRVVHANLNGGDRSTRYRLIPSCMFTDPDLARAGIEYRSFTLPTAAVSRSRTLSEPRGFMTMLVEADSDRILGFSAFGVEASELLAAVQTAMIGNLPYSAPRDGICTHPAMSEALVFLLSAAPRKVSWRS